MTSDPIKIADELDARLELGVPIDDDMLRTISALLRRFNPPEGSVRLPDGRDVKVLGTLPMTADGCVVGDNAKFWLLCEEYDDGGECIAYAHNRMWVMDGPDKGSWGLVDSIESCYSTRAAAEAASKEGK